MIYEKAYAKINLALEVKQKVNNFHNVNNIMIPISLYDELFFEKSDMFSIESNIDIKDNIIEKAYNLFKEKYNIGGVKIILKKNIPLMAGLAGGSSDAGAVLRGLNRLYGLNLSVNELELIGKELGSDVPFFLYNKISLCTGRGEVINPLDIDFSGVPVLLIKPNFGLSTKEIYQNYLWSGIDKSKEIKNLLECLNKKDIKKVDELIFNDLENVSLKISESLNEIFNKVKGLSYNPHISGSGPTIFILDGNSKDYEIIKNLFDDCKVISCYTI